MQLDRRDSQSVCFGDAKVRELSRSGSVFIPGGTFGLGSDKHHREDASVHRVTVHRFCMNRAPVTNRQFKQFVKATGFVTLAEIPPDPQDYPRAAAHAPNYC